MAFVKDQVPPGGWKFLEGNISIEEDTFDKLVYALTAHRMNNGKPTGAPALEIQEQTQKRINDNG